MTTVKNVPAKLYYKQKYDQYKQLLDTKLRQDVFQGSYNNVIQDYHAECTRGELCTKYKHGIIRKKRVKLYSFVLIIKRFVHNYRIRQSFVTVVIYNIKATIMELHR